MASGVHKVDISWDRRSSGVVANVVFDNSRRLNVLNPPALLDLTEAFLGLAREDDLRVVVLSGAGGRAFIGGADINHMVTMKAAEDGRLPSERTVGGLRLFSIEAVRQFAEQIKGRRAR